MLYRCPCIWQQLWLAQHLPRLPRAGAKLREALPEPDPGGPGGVRREGEGGGIRECGDGGEGAGEAEPGQSRLPVAPAAAQEGADSGRGGAEQEEDQRGQRPNPSTTQDCAPAPPNTDTLIRLSWQYKYYILPITFIKPHCLKVCKLYMNCMWTQLWSVP